MGRVAQATGECRVSPDTCICPMVQQWPRACLCWGHGGGGTEYNKNLPALGLGASLPSHGRDPGGRTALPTCGA